MHVYSVNWIYAKDSTSQSHNVMTFTTNVGLRRYKRLSFGINSAAEIFQNAIQNALEGLEGVRNISDDIIVFGCNWQEHDQRLKATFKRLQEKHLTVNNMRGSRNFVRGVQARQPKNSLDDFLCVFFQSSTYFTVYIGGPMVLLQRKLYFSKDPEGVQHFPGGGSNIFRGGGGGPNAAIETHIACDFRGGGGGGSGPPIPPLHPHMNKDKCKLNNPSLEFGITR